MGDLYAPARARIDAFVRSASVFGLTLDLGCGEGPYRNAFSPRIGFDRESGPSVDVVGDAHFLPFKDQSFDNVVCTEVLEHLLDPFRAVKEIERVLRHGGSCLVSTRFCYPIHMAPHDFFRFSEFALRHLFASWQIVLLEPDTDMMTTIIEIVGYRARQVGGSLPGRIFRRLSWSILWRLWRFISAWRKVGPSFVAPSGYLLIARKPTNRLDSFEERPVRLDSSLRHK